MVKYEYILNKEEIIYEEKICSLFERDFDVVFSCL